MKNSPLDPTVKSRKRSSEGRFGIVFAVSPTSRDEVEKRLATKNHEQYFDELVTSEEAAAMLIVELGPNGMWSKRLREMRNPGFIGWNIEALRPIAHNSRRAPQYRKSEIMRFIGDVRRLEGERRPYAQDTKYGFNVFDTHSPYENWARQRSWPIKGKSGM